MFVDKPRVKSWVSISAILGFVILAVYLFFFSNIGEIVGVIANINIAIYIAAFVCVLGGATFNALTWHQILDKLSVKTKFRRIFTLSWVGSFIDAIIPGGWTGDIFKGYLLSKDNGVDGAKTAASIVVKKLFETFVSVGALVLGIVLLATNFSISSEIFVAIGLTMTLFALPMILILYLSMNAGRSQRILHLMGRLSKLLKGKRDSGPDFEANLKKSLEEFREGLLILKSKPKAMLKPLVLQTIAWGFDILTLFLIFACIGYIVSPDKIIISNTIAVNLQVQGFALAGVTPMLSSALYSMLGISSLVSISSSLLTSFPTFWFKVIISFFAFQAIVLNHAVPAITRKTAELNAKIPQAPPIFK